MGLLLQAGPLLEVGKAHAHIAGLQPGVAAALTAVRPYVAGRTFVLFARRRPVHGLLEDLPSLPDSPSAQVVVGDREGRAEVHPAVGGDGESTAPAGTLDEPVIRRAEILDTRCGEAEKSGPIDRDLVLGTQTVLKGCLVAVGLRHDVQPILESPAIGFDQLPAG